MSSVSSARIHYLSGYKCVDGGAARFSVDGREVKLYADLQQQALLVNGCAKSVAGNHQQIGQLIASIPDASVRTALASAFGFPEHTRAFFT